jgi:hypothetical protein
MVGSVAAILALAVLIGVMSFSCSQPSSASAAAPTFLEKGRSYNFLHGSVYLRATVLDIDPSGWVRAREYKGGSLTNSLRTYWVNTNAVGWITIAEEK